MAPIGAPMGGWVPALCGFHSHKSKAAQRNDFCEQKPSGAGKIGGAARTRKQQLSSFGVLGVTVISAASRSAGRLNQLAAAHTLQPTGWTLRHFWAGIVIHRWPTRGRGGLHSLAHSRVRLCLRGYRSGRRSGGFLRHPLRGHLPPDGIHVSGLRGNAEIVRHLIGRNCKFGAIGCRHGVSGRRGADALNTGPRRDADNPAVRCRGNTLHQEQDAIRCQPCRCRCYDGHRSRSWRLGRCWSRCRSHRRGRCGSQCGLLGRL
jgi:hypothetical protein